jgi:hypothetical protein
MVMPQVLKPINSTVLNCFGLYAKNTALAYGSQHYSYQQLLSAAWHFAERLQLPARSRQHPIAIYSTKTA